MTEEPTRPDPAGERFRAIGMQAAGVAHDLNNVLAAILAVAEEALADGARDAATASRLAEIQENAARGAALVRKLLGAGAREAAPAPVVGLDECVRAAAPLLRRLLGPDIGLAVRHVTPGLHARIEPGELERILTNLAVNARDAMPDGGKVVIRIEEIGITAPQSPHGEAIRPGRYACIEVADTGAGIAAELLGRLFTPFVTTKRDGTGLGLAVVNDLARRADGFLLIDSAPGRGTRVRLHLPVASRDAASRPAPPPASAFARAGVQSRTVLLVEDEDAIRQFTEQGLRRRGWRVLAASSAVEARGLVRSSEAGRPTTPALLISDVALPGQDGLALLAELRRDHPDLPAIITSGYADGALRRACAEARAVLLIKPHPLRLLLETAVTLAGEPDSGHAPALPGSTGEVVGCPENI